MMFWTKLEQVVVWACLIERGGGGYLVGVFRLSGNLYLPGDWAGFVLHNN